MIIKNLKSIILAVLLALPLSLPVNSQAALVCADLFTTIEKRQSRSFSFLPQFITERSQHEIVRLAAKDSRLASLRLAEASSVLNRLDNLTSPALIQTAVLHRKAPAEFGQYLKSMADASNTISTSLSANAHVPDHVKVMFDLFESRYRTAVEILGASYMTKTGIKSDFKNADYAHHLIESLRNSVIEISKSSKYKNYFLEFDFRTVNWSEVAAHIETSLVEKPLFSFELPTEQVMFQKNFLDQLNVDVSIPQMLDESGRYLDARIAEMPVGISYRVAELTSTVRFGIYQFYGNWFNYTSTDRSAYLRMGKKLGGIMEAELRVSNEKKKLMAVLLDRSHQKLDPVFALENKTGRCFNTCGSFAPIMFMRAGVPIVSPAYLTPSTTFVSLALQKFLGFKNVESIKFTQLSPTGAAMDVPIIMLHEAGPVSMEIGIYMSTLSSIGTFLYSLF